MMNIANESGSNETAVTGGVTAAPERGDAIVNTSANFACGGDR